MTGIDDMWNDWESVQIASKRATGWAVLSAFLSGITGLLSLANVVPQVLTIASVVLAFVSGSAGLFALIADKRKDKLEDKFKRTPPKVEATIKTGQEDGKFYVVIEPRNDVPFEEQWMIVTLNNEIISGIPLDWTKIVPNSEHPHFHQQAGMDLSKVRDGYIELRFNYRSVFAAELPNLDLAGRFVKRYRLSPDQKYCIPIE